MAVASMSSYVLFLLGNGSYVKEFENCRFSETTESRPGRDEKERAGKGVPETTGPDAAALPTVRADGRGEERSAVSGQRPRRARLIRW
ncbi:MAG: hypothetical protein ACTHL1_10545, partial [Burkholderiaceae bacterium]